MTQKIAKKVELLLKTTEKNLPRVGTKEDLSFATSAAKYYPALKKLAAK